METCVKPAVKRAKLITLTNYEKRGNEIKKIDDEKEKMEIEAPEIEIIKEKICEKKENQTEVVPKIREAVSIVDGKKLKKKKGEKRKLSGKVYSCKKIKVIEREKKSLGNASSNPVVVDTEAQSRVAGSEIKGDENDSDAENHEIQAKEKSKQMSEKKQKAVANACRKTLAILMSLDSDALGAMEKSLKILKSHNFLNSKLVPVDTLIELVALAVETSKMSEMLDSEKELNLSRIVSKLEADACAPPKPRGRPRSTPAVISPVKQEESPASGVTSKNGEDRDIQIVKEPEEKMEESGDVDSRVKVEEQSTRKSGSNFCITNYFKKLKKTVEEKEKNKNERFSVFTAKTDMYLAPKLGGELTGLRRQKFEEDFTSQNSEVNYLVKQALKATSGEALKPKSSAPNAESESHESETGEGKSIEKTDEAREAGDVAGSAMETDVKVESESPVVIPVEADRLKPFPLQSVSRTKAKLFQFHDNRRPPYWGTWRRKSKTVGGRRPFAKDKLFNYEIDSDDEWEGEEEPGESLHGSDDEKEPEEDYEVDNDFFVPHGYLSDDENPEKENMSPKTKLDLLEEQFSSERKQKTRKMTPIIFGTFWLHKGLPPEGSQFHDLQIERLNVVSWSTTPIQIEEEEKNEGADQQEPSSQSKKPRTRMSFPEEEIPSLIKMIHGSPDNSHLLAKKFLLHWETERSQESKRVGSLSKACVMKKIKELAAWQSSQERGKMCWNVSQETRKEFGAQVESEGSAKKSQKCFIWNFMKKTEKPPSSEPDAQPPDAQPPDVQPTDGQAPEAQALQTNEEPEVMIIDP